jgi:predicted RNA polymerase sigma factor
VGRYLAARIDSLLQPFLGLEAAIQSAHVTRRLTGSSKWRAVVALYDHLLAFTRSPVVILNREQGRAVMGTAETH